MLIFKELLRSKSKHHASCNNANIMQDSCLSQDTSWKYLESTSEKRYPSQGNSVVNRRQSCSNNSYYVIDTCATSPHLSHLTRTTVLKICRLQFATMQIPCKVIFIPTRTHLVPSWEHLESTFRNMLHK